MSALAVEVLGHDEAMGERLRADLKDTRRLSMAVAFAKESALQVVDLERWSRRDRELRLLAGIDFTLTELSLLRRLEPLPGATCRIFVSSEAACFHPKLYVLDKADRRVVYVGSSNFTQGGLAGNIEANVRLEAPVSAPEIEKPARLFERLFNSEFSAELSPEFEARYREMQEARRQALARAPSKMTLDLLHAAENLLLGAYRTRTANRRFLLVVNPTNYAICMRTLTWGRQHRHEIEAYHASDVFFFHVTGGRGIAAMGMFHGDPYYDETSLWPASRRGVFPWRIRFKPFGDLKTGINTRATLEPLRPGAPSHWFNGFIQQSHALEQRDFAALHRAFEVALRLDQGLKAL